MINNNPWKTLSSKVMYENPWMSIREDAVLRPDDAQSVTGFYLALRYVHNY
jgi:hypothetical protein